MDGVNVIIPPFWMIKLNKKEDLDKFIKKR